MMARARRSLPLIAVLVAVIALGGTSADAARPSAIGGPSWALLMEIDSPFIEGGGALPSEPVTIKHRRDGRTIARGTTTVNGIGMFAMRLKPLKGGDQLVITVGTQKRVITVPDLRIRADLTTGVVSGRVPAGTATADGSVSLAIGTKTLDDTPFSVPTASDGTFTSTGHDVSGSDLLYLSWADPVTRDVTELRRRIPAFEVRAGSATVTIVASWGKRLTATLVSPRGAIRGRATGTITPELDAIRRTFRRDGAPVKVRPGDRVTLSGSRGRLTVRRPDLVASSLGLTATCVSARLWMADTIPPVGPFDHLAAGKVRPEGVVIGSWIDPLPSGARVLLRCEHAKGWVQLMAATVP